MIFLHYLSYETLGDQHINQPFPLVANLPSYRPTSSLYSEDHITLVVTNMGLIMKMSLPNAQPYSFNFPLAATAFIIIDMQRDFLEPDGFGSIQCGNPEIFSSVRGIVPTVQAVLEAARSIEMQVIHTREGHRSDLLDLPAAKKLRQISASNGHHTMAIGDKGPMGRLLVRGEWGHDIIDELAPHPGELVVDKPGKGSFWGTELHRLLLARGITHLIFAGVTTE